MMRYSFFLSIALALFRTVTSMAQDSLQILSAEEVLQIVREFHPVARQTDLAIEKAKADILIAKGQFDPVLSNYVARKTFNGTEYYHQTSPGITIPTWYGIEVYGGLENLTGARTNPTQTQGKSSYLGISVPIGKDLILDKRRAFLKQAKLFRSMAQTEQRSVINNLLLEAMEAYWQWVRDYQTYRIMRNTVEINQKRLELVRKSFLNGERPAVDTLEALTQLQSFQYQENAYYLEFQNSGLGLSAYLWKKDGEPYVLPVTVVPQLEWARNPETFNYYPDLADFMELAYKGHPDLQLYDFKDDVLQVDKKLKFQELLPKADLNYNHLAKGYDVFGSVPEAAFLQNNYQYGFKFEIPLRLSQGRGEYRKAKLKIEENRLEQQRKRLAIELKIKSYYNELVNLRNQITLQRNNYQNYQQLVRAEEIRFANGESSLFLINSRENKVLEAQGKLIDLQTKFFKTVYALQWSAGLLN